MASPQVTDEKHDDRKRIISVTMSQALVARIDELVQQRIGRSRAQLIEDAVRWFIDLTVYKWSERGIYIDSSRVILESETLSSLYFSRLTPADQYELGVTAGKQAPVADVVRLFHSKDPRDPENFPLVLRLLQDQGWGAITLRDDLIVISSPFYPPSFVRGFLESLLGIRLRSVETSTKDTVALRIVK